MRHAETKALNLLSYEVIQLGMEVEAGASRDEANPTGTRVHKEIFF